MSGLLGVGVNGKSVGINSRTVGVTVKSVPGYLMDN